MPNRFPPSLRGGWYLCFWLSILLSMDHWAYVWYVIRETQSTDMLGQFHRVVSKRLFPAYPEPRTAVMADQRVFLTAASLSMGCAVFVLEAPLGAFLGWSWGAWVNWYFLFGAVAVFLQFHLAWRLCSERSIWCPGPPKEFLPPPNTAFLAALLWGLAGCVVCIWSSLAASGRFKSGYFFAYRCFGLTSGVAPNVPILLLTVALYGWALMQMKRATRVGVRRMFTERV
jgi:hypothetical protein